MNKHCCIVLVRAVPTTNVLEIVGIYVGNYTMLVTALCQESVQCRDVEGDGTYSKQCNVGFYMSDKGNYTACI